MPVFLFDITSSGVHHRICGTSVGRASLDICNLPPLPQLGERHECTVIFYRLLKIIFQYRNSDIQLDMLQQFENFWLFLLLYQRLCGGIVFVATPVTQDNTATALCILTACINRSDGEMMLQRRTKRPMWRRCVASIKPALRMFVPCFFLTCHYVCHPYVNYDHQNLPLWQNFVCINIKCGINTLKKRCSLINIKQQLWHSMYCLQRKLASYDWHNCTGEEL